MIPMPLGSLKIILAMVFVFIFVFAFVFVFAHENVCTSLFSDLGRGKSMCVLLRGAYKMGKNVARSGH